VVPGATAVAVATCDRGHPAHSLHHSCPASGLPALWQTTRTRCVPSSGFLLQLNESLTARCAGSSCPSAESVSIRGARKPLRPESAHAPRPARVPLRVAAPVGPVVLQADRSRMNAVLAPAVLHSSARARGARRTRAGHRAIAKPV
jgi:hypothetical protein